MQDEISKAIVAALKLKLLAATRRWPSSSAGRQSAEAYNLYLLARQYWLTGNHRRSAARRARDAHLQPRGRDRSRTTPARGRCSRWLSRDLRYAFRCQVDDGFAGRAFGANRSIRRSPKRTCRRCGGSRNGGAMPQADAEMDAALRLDPQSWEVNKEAARVAMRQAPRRMRRRTRKGGGADGQRHSCLGEAGDAPPCARRSEAKRMAAETTVAQAEQLLSTIRATGPR